MMAAQGDQSSDLAKSLPLATQKIIEDALCYRWLLEKREGAATTAHLE